MIRAGLIALALFSSLPAVADPQFSGNDDLHWTVFSPVLCS